MPKDFLWGPGVKKNRRADLCRHVNFVFIKPLSRHPKTPQVFYWAYILIAHIKENRNYKNEVRYVLRVLRTFCTEISDTTEKWWR